MSDLIEIVTDFAEAADKQFAAVHKALAALREDVLEGQVRNNPGKLLGSRARRLHVVTLDELLDSVGATLGDDEYELVSQADAFLWGTERGTGDQIVVVAEATWRISMRDVTRAAAWTRQLGALGVHVHGAIVAAEPPRDDVLAAAESASVWVVVDPAAREAA